MILGVVDVSAERGLWCDREWYLFPPKDDDDEMLYEIMKIRRNYIFSLPVALPF